GPRELRTQRRSVEAEEAGRCSQHSPGGERSAGLRSRATEAPLGDALAEARRALRRDATRVLRCVDPREQPRLYVRLELIDGDATPLGDPRDASLAAGAAIAVARGGQRNDH